MLATRASAVADRRAAAAFPALLHAAGAGRARADRAEQVIRAGPVDAEREARVRVHRGRTTPAVSLLTGAAPRSCLSRLRSSLRRGRRHRPAHEPLGIAMGSPRAPGTVANTATLWFGRLSLVVQGERARAARANTPKRRARGAAVRREPRAD